MAISYKKLWKLLIDKDMKKSDLLNTAGISRALDCTMDDIMEILPEK